METNENSDPAKLLPLLMKGAVMHTDSYMRGSFWNCKTNINFLFA